jgi:hypothetical protein
MLAEVEDLMKKLHGLAALEELRHLLSDSEAGKPATPSNPVSDASPAATKPAAPQRTAKTCEGKPPTLPQFPAHSAPRPPQPVRPAEPRIPGLGGGQILVKSKQLGEFRFDKTRTAVEQTLQRMYGRTDLVSQDGNQLYIYVPLEDIGSWIGSRGIVAATLKTIYGVEFVNVKDIKELG